VNGEWIYPIAEELLRRGIPFMFLTGYSRIDLAEQFREMPHLMKPYDPKLLGEQLSALLEKR